MKRHCVAVLKCYDRGQFQAALRSRRGTKAFAAPRPRRRWEGNTIRTSGVVGPNRDLEDEEQPSVSQLRLRYALLSRARSDPRPVPKWWPPGREQPAGAAVVPACASPSLAVGWTSPHTPPWRWTPGPPEPGAPIVGAATASGLEAMARRVQEVAVESVLTRPGVFPCSASLREPVATVASECGLLERIEWRF